MIQDDYLQTPSVSIENSPSFLPDSLDENDFVENMQPVPVENIEPNRVQVRPIPVKNITIPVQREPSSRIRNLPERLIY